MQNIPFAFALVLSALLLSLPAKGSAETAPCDTSFFNASICPGQSYFIAGTIFDIQNTMGSVVLPGASWDGTDSVVIVSLMLLPPVTSYITANYCSNEALFINGHIYDASNPSGVELLPGAAAGGCDSMVVVELTFLTPPDYHLVQTICSNDTVWVNNQAYDQYYYLGMEVIEGGGANGCDSTILVDLTVLPAPADTIQQFLCPYETQNVNGTEYDFEHPSGLEILPNASINGCDSLVYVYLTFSQPPVSPGFLGEDRLINLGDSICISIPVDTNIESITWNPAQPCTSPDCSSVCIRAVGPEVLTATIIDQNKCSFSDDIRLSITEIRPVFAPNVFSADAEPPNNRFTIFSGINDTKVNWMRVYDRWGSSVYEAQDFGAGETEKGWDGTIKGKTAPSDVYTFACELLYPDGATEIRSGTVTFLR